ncbi:MAG: uroporphyrinogen decarboxylase [Pseudomonadota bacterium]|nr:uroporphyrinogen decarboxylase [Pseudomonadota bacterium]
MGRFLQALRREQVDCTPVWMMRQAGRYLPEYRALRERHGSFMNVCKTPELACEVTLQPLARFDLDAAIIFSDILTIPDAMGLGLHFDKGEGPRFERPVQTKAAVEALGVPDMASDLRYVSDAIRLAVRELAGKMPLIGFSGSPWTIATYMVEGGTSKSFGVIKRMMFADPEILHSLLALLAKTVVEYLQAQIDAGVSAVMIFDTWGGVLSTREYMAFSLQYMREIVSALRKNPHNLNIPIILFTKNGGQWLESLADTGCDALGLDWTTDLALARTRVGAKVALQGNMDPAILYASPSRIREEVALILEQFGDNPGHVFNLGHGILPDVPPENAAVFIEAVHELSAARRRK